MTSFRMALKIIAIISLFFFTSSKSIALPLGINTNEVMQVDSSVPFVDVFKMSLPFDEADAKLTRGNIRYDTNGWPAQINGGQAQAGTNVLHWLPAGTLPVGLYTVLYDGEGQINFHDDAVVRQQTPGKIIIHIDPRNDAKNGPGHEKFIKVTMTITETNPQNYVRNIRILMPGGICARNPYKRVNSPNQCGGDYLDFATHHESIIFNPDYLTFMKDFGVIRFMNMSGITRNPLSSWDQMPHLDEATWAGREGRRGAPLEIMVELANKLNKHAWFTLPHAADNRLIQQYAQYVKANLRPHLKVYLEYTNEAWNPSFTHWAHMKTQGVRLRLDNDHNNAGHKYYVKRSLEVFNIWERTFGGKQRLVRVLGGWTPNTRLTELMMEYNQAYRHIDALAIAPYFFVHKKVQHGINSVPDVFKKLKEDSNPYSVQNVFTMLEKQKALADKYQVELIAYEGGQHLVAYGNRSTRDVPTKYYVGANRAWPMEKMYTEFLQGWQRITGNKLFVAFSSPRTYQAYGCWGVKEHINQPAGKAPKYRALAKFFR